MIEIHFILPIICDQLMFDIFADTVRRNLGMAREFAKKEPYDKLEKALLCGLPNEVDFAINVCTLLSNEGKQGLNVTKSPRLIEILMAHVGIFRDGAGSLFTLHHEGWRPCTKRNFERVSIRVGYIKFKGTSLFCSRSNQGYP